MSFRGCPETRDSVPPPVLLQSIMYHRMPENSEMVTDADTILAPASVLQALRPGNLRGLDFQ